MNEGRHMAVDHVCQKYKHFFLPFFHSPRSPLPFLRMGKISITVLLFFKRELNIDRKIGERIIQGAKMICTTTSGIWSY